MKKLNSIFRFGLPAILFLSVPIIYNSCGDEKKSFKSDTTSTQSCKVAAHKLSSDQVIDQIAARESALSASPVFEEGAKLRLDFGPQSLSIMSKLASGDESQDKEITVLVNLACAREQSDSLAWAFIKDQVLDPEWRIQAFTAQLSDLFGIKNYRSRIETDPCIKGIAPNQVYDLQAVPSYQINDPYLLSESHLRTINAQKAFAYFYNSDFGIDGSAAKVRVAILDTGIQYLHPEFTNQFYRFDPVYQWWGRDVTQDGLLGSGTQINNVQDISADGHGTHVAGIIGALINNQIGVAGIASRNVALMNYKVFTNNPAIISGCQSGSTCTNSTIVANAIQDALQHNADVINLSLGRLATGSDSKVDETYRNAIAQAVNAGAVVVMAGGNATSAIAAQQINDSTFTVIPARYGKDYQGAITVGSVDIDFQGAIRGKSSFSHYSTTHIEIGAPGSEGANGIWSTAKTVGSAGQGSYQQLLGTSISAPMVSAAAALAIGIYRQTYGSDPSPAQVEDWLETSAKKVPSLTTYFKDGNSLDLEGLVTLMKSRMPELFGGAVAEGCVPVGN